MRKNRFIFNQTCYLLKTKDIFVLRRTQNDFFVLKYAHNMNVQ